MQKTDYGVEVLAGGVLFAGKCLLQILNNNVISYQYRKQESQIDLKNYENGLPSAPLLHGDNCPCENRNLQPNNGQFSKIRLATVAMVCDKDYNFLITRRHQQLKTFPKAWVFPGGMVEKNQNLENECLRELEEETGIDIINILDSIELKVFYESVFPTVLQENQYPLKQTLCMFYEVKLKQSFNNINVQIQENEVDNYKWINKNALLDIMNNSKNENFQEMSGIYPNQYGSGIGEGHVKAFRYCYNQ